VTIAELLIFGLVCYSVVITIEEGEATFIKRPREWLKRKSSFFKGLLECRLCLGWWVGIALGVKGHFTSLLPAPTYLVDYFVLGALGGISSLILDHLVNLLWEATKLVEEVRAWWK